MSQMARAHQIIEGGTAGRAFTGKLLYAVSAAVIDDAGVSVFDKAPHHIGAHAP